MTYVVHGAAGAQGKPVLSALKNAGKAVVGIGRKQGADTGGDRYLPTSYDSVEQLTEAYHGAESVFVHLPLGSEADRLRFANNIVAALTAARPARVVISTSGQIIDTPGSALQHADDSAVPVLVRGVANAGLSSAVIAARTFLENLLLPPVTSGVRSDGVLRYPVRSDLPVSWSSHLDVADVAVALFERTDVSGIVAVGQLPAITGPDLAEAFSTRLGRRISYEAITPDQFAEIVTAVIGEAGATAVRGRYSAMAELADFTFPLERSAQHILDVNPRTTLDWLNQLGF